MNRPGSTKLLAIAAAGLLAFAGNAAAQDLLLRNATVHTATDAGTLRATDVLVRNGRIAAVGTGLPAPSGVTVVEASGRPLTPAMFGGITGIGIEEVSGEDPTVDATLTLGAGSQPVMTVRPEFDVTLAFNPASSLIPVARIEGIGFTLLHAGTGRGGSIIGGQGGTVRLDGRSLDTIGPKVLFVALGAENAGLTGDSRAAQWMLLDQLLDEARGRIAPESRHSLLTPAGRATLKRFVDGDGLWMVEVDRAVDIVQLLRWADRHDLRVAISGGSEAWAVAPQLAAAGVPVFVDPLANLPGNFDTLGATMENAARLRKAGVAVGFSQAGDASHNARKVRQLAGNAVANGLPWDAALAGLTSVPARTLGLGDQLGSIAVGRRADLVLWSGDPLELTSLPDQVWLDGRAQPMRSRQTELRDRYMK